MADNAKKGDNDKTKNPPPPPAPAVPGTSQQQQADPLSPEKIKELITEALNVKLNEYSSHYRDIIKQESEIMKLEIETKWAGFNPQNPKTPLNLDLNF